LDNTEPTGFESEYEVAILSHKYTVTSTNYFKARLEAAKIYKDQFNSPGMSVADIARNSRASRLTNGIFSRSASRKLLSQTRKILEEKTGVSLQLEVTLSSNQRVDLLGRKDTRAIIVEVKVATWETLGAPIQLLTYRNQLLKDFPELKEVELYLSLPTISWENLQRRGYYEVLLQILDQFHIDLLVVDTKTNTIEKPTVWNK